MNRFSGECEHGTRTIDADDGNFRKSFHESDRDVRRAAAKIDDAPSGEIGKPFSKIAWDLSMRFGPVRGSICGGLLSVVHQFGFRCALHLFSVGPAVRIASVRRFYLCCALSGLRFAAASYYRPVPPRLILCTTSSTVMSSSLLFQIIRARRPIGPHTRGSVGPNSAIVGQPR